MSSDCQQTAALGAAEPTSQGAGENDNDSGVDENTQLPGGGSLKKTAGQPGSSRIPKKTPPDSPVKSRSRHLKPAGAVPRSKSVPKPFTAYSSPPSTSESRKKVPMNKIQVGVSASPNLKAVHSKVGSMVNSSHKPGGGNVRIEHRKLEWSTSSRTNNFNEGYVPGGGNRTIESRKLEWNVASKVGSLDNASHKPGGGTKLIPSEKLVWNTTSKVGSTDNIKHKPGGGNVKIIDRKLHLKVESKVGSLDNVNHKPGGGEKKVFNDVEYLRQMSEASSVHVSGNVSRTSSRRESTTQLNPKHGCSSEARSTLVEVNNGKTPAAAYQYEMKRRMSPMSSGF